MEKEADALKVADAERAQVVAYVLIALGGLVACALLAMRLWQCAGVAVALEWSGVHLLTSLVDNIHPPKKTADIQITNHGAKHTPHL